MAHQVVEPHDQRQEFVARDLGALSQSLQQVLEGMRATLDALEPERRRLALDLVHLAEQQVDLVAELAVGPRRDPQDRVDQLQCGLAVRQEGAELFRIDLHDAEQHVELRRCACLRFLEVAGEQDARSDVVDRHEDLPDTAVPLDAVEIELEVPRVASRRPVVQRDLDLRQRVDALDQVLVGTLAPQQLDVLGRGGQRRVRDQAVQQVLESEALERIASEQRCEGRGMGPADPEIRVDQEQAILHGGQDVPGLFLGLASDVLARGPCATGSTPAVRAAGRQRRRRQSSTGATSLRRRPLRVRGPHRRSPWRRTVAASHRDPHRALRECRPAAGDRRDSSASRPCRNRGTAGPRIRQRHRATDDTGTIAAQRPRALGTARPRSAGVPRARRRIRRPARPGRRAIVRHTCRIRGDRVSRPATAGSLPAGHVARSPVSTRRYSP